MHRGGSTPIAARVMSAHAIQAALSRVSSSVPSALPHRCQLALTRMTHAASSVRTNAELCDAAERSDTDGRGGVAREAYHGLATTSLLKCGFPYSASRILALRPARPSSQAVEHERWPFSAARRPKPAPHARCVRRAIDLRMCAHTLGLRPMPAQTLLSGKAARAAWHLSQTE
ncbi:hypothetical protein C8Q80DRAFT_865252 [Daedaleopsis nitida]|nr:hypothetical protein C8Q80DRAFT_865252 [Daedaleopsis nitida]